ncbi:MAG: hypothetical protein J7M39_09795 [Anaerolineae bacterium]|nr:hypothetical protein [Anaerolineae bacterium]
MSKAVLFYISAASDLETEREILGRAVADVPGDLDFRVVQSPDGNGVLDVDAIASADVHIVVMGSDIRAPVGLEWQLARQSGRPPVVFLRHDTLRTPAGLNFVRFVAQFQMWEPFDSGTMLRTKVLKLLADRILAQAVRYGLTADEIVRLHVWRNALATSPQAVDEVTRGGAGESSIVLSRRRIVTAGGVVIEEVRGS